MMNIYKIEVIKESGQRFVRFEGAVVSADNDELAKRMHPDDGKDISRLGDNDQQTQEWTNDPENVRVRLLGKYEGNTSKILLASFNAG
ncbi:MAG: hypothetical protein R8M45_01700 [Ghiorsea sp.]